MLRWEGNVMKRNTDGFLSLLLLFNKLHWWCCYLPNLVKICSTVFFCFLLENLNTPGLMKMDIHKATKLNQNIPVKLSTKWNYLHGDTQLQHIPGMLLSWKARWTWVRTGTMVWTHSLWYVSTISRRTSVERRRAW